MKRKSPKSPSCVISFFYIKPQPWPGITIFAEVALYLSSTSNHNSKHPMSAPPMVALYLSSTSNHNLRTLTVCSVIVALYLSSTSNHNTHALILRDLEVALYLSSTSNHNPQMSLTADYVLRYIFLLHQTTTVPITLARLLGCVISFFYIKPQPEAVHCLRSHRCVISFFYIKPQLKILLSIFIAVALYLSSTSNHNETNINRYDLELRYIFLLHQTTTWE